MGNSIITAGVRHLRVWRLEQPSRSSPTKGRYVESTPSSPAPKTLPGRNCVLGSLITSTFTCVAAISDSMAVVGTERGEICRLADANQNQRLDKVATVPFKVFCISVVVENNVILIGGKDGEICQLDLSDLLSSRDLAETAEDSPVSSSEQHPHRRVESISDIVAIGSMHGRTISVSSSHSIKIWEPLKSSEKVSVGEPTKSIAAHDNAVLGATILSRPNNRDSDLLTWSSTGQVYFWAVNGTTTLRDEITVGIEQLNSLEEEEDSNELTIVRGASDDMLLYGDMYGNVGFVIDSAMSVKAHDGEVRDMALSHREESVTLLATCGRDRTLQIFEVGNQRLSILQTLEQEHSATINSLLFLNNGSTLVSASGDRTIVARSSAVLKGDRIAFVTSRVINLKSSPVSIAPTNGHSDHVIVSTLDRCFSKYDVISGQLLQTFKATDIWKTDNVVLNSITAGRFGSADNGLDVLCAASSTDRSIRVYDLDTGSLLAQEYAQLAVSDLAFLSQEAEDGKAPSQCLISASLDGTVMMWSLTHTELRSADPTGGYLTPNESPRLHGRYVASCRDQSSRNFKGHWNPPRTRLRPLGAITLHE